MISVESKILFIDGENERVIRGLIESEDEFFITLRRRDGTLRIAKSCIKKIEQWNNNRVEGEKHGRKI